MLGYEGSEGGLRALNPKMTDARFATGQEGSILHRPGADLGSDLHPTGKRAAGLWVGTRKIPLQNESETKRIERTSKQDLLDRISTIRKAKLTRTK